MRKVLIGVSVGAVALIVAAVAMGATVQTITSSVSTGSGKPKANKHGTLKITISAQDQANQPSQQPNPARQIDFGLPKGLTLDTKAANKCSASDTDFQNNANACPSNTKVATGSAVVNTGLNPPVTRINASVTGYNGGSQLILYVVPQGAQPIVIRAKITGKPSSGQHLKTNITPNCIPPGKPTDSPPCQGREAPIESFTLQTLSKHKGSGSKRHDLVTTPKTCPKAGWKFSVKVTFRNIPPQSPSTQVGCRS